jgi:UDPglucose 6-dehydrogenase
LKKPRISVIGTGYVGLCTAVAFAEKGYSVIAADTDIIKINKISQGIPPFHEPNLETLLKRTIRKGLLQSTLKTEEAVKQTDITFVTVGTPSKRDGSINLHYVYSAVGSIGKALKQKETYHLVIIKSTVIPGTTQEKLKPILETETGRTSGSDFGLCTNPEFLRQGSAIQDTLQPDRIIIGEYDKRSGDILFDFYKDIYAEKMPPTIRTSLSTAELIKYANNSMLATKISFINTIANISEKIPGADVKTVATAIGLDKRISPLFLNAGIGYGGSCFPKDLKALIASSKNLRYQPTLLEAVEKVNKTQPQRAIQLCKKKLGNLSKKNIAILGLAFKPDTDDMREAKAIPIINQLLKEGAKITAYDPAARSTAKAIFKDKIKYALSATECLRNADCAIIVTEWKEFKELKPEDFTKNMRRPLVIDGRRIYNQQEFSQKLEFQAIGLGHASKENIG